jgi:hypothetical protein
VLMTKSMREAVVAKRAAVRSCTHAEHALRCAALTRWPRQEFSRALVRVELPGDALVLEAAFAPLEPLSALRELVAACLAPDAAAAFYLFTAPPKARLVRGRDARQRRCVQARSGEATTQRV